jgi:hypothetical protein
MVKQESALAATLMNSYASVLKVTAESGSSTASRSCRHTELQFQMWKAFEEQVRYIFYDLRQESLGGKIGIKFT